MARPSRSRALALWANGQHVGRWLVPASGPMELTYDPKWVTSKEGRPISLSLPMNLDGSTLKGDRVGFFFDNLLPDNEAIRRRVQAHFATPSGDAFDLLAAIGRDCVGALQLLPEGTTPAGVTKIDVTPLTDVGVEKMLLGGMTPPLGSRATEDDEDLRISIAGAQEKTALTWHEKRWCKPHGSTPTTHIFKLPLGVVGARGMDMSASLENEWLCAQLLRRYGVPVASCELERFGATSALVVERFDRMLHRSGRYWLRLPQEDFCQATGTPSSKKYESDGGPGLPEIARVLAGSDAREQDLATLMRAQLLFWMLAAIDGHAKNFSIRILPEGRFRLTPLYDVLSAWPVTGLRHDQQHVKKLKLAMALRGGNKHNKVAEIRRRHFDMTAKLCGLGSDMEDIITDVIENTPNVIEDVGASLPKGFPEALFDSMAKGLRTAAKQIERMAR
jgi:serine/threonine-protein kinase HipA